MRRTGKNIKTDTFTRIMALVLCVMVILTTGPVSAFAEAMTEEGEAQVTLLQEETNAVGDLSGTDNSNAAPEENVSSGDMKTDAAADGIGTSGDPVPDTQDIDDTDPLDENVSGQPQEEEEPDVPAALEDGTVPEDRTDTEQVPEENKQQDPAGDDADQADKKEDEASEGADTDKEEKTDSKGSQGDSEEELRKTSEPEADEKTDEEESSGEEISSSVEMRGVSLTNNIVGDVFVNMMNDANKKLQSGAKGEDPSLDKYPLEHHELSYYGSSPRVRILETGDEEGPNYLVYRDSYLLISQEDSAEYEVRFSEDKRTAYVYPSIPQEMLTGKIGIVFLADNVGNDTILVFSGTPVDEEGGLTVPLEATDNIKVNQLFSDGKLTYTGESNNRKGGAKAGEELEAGASWTSKVSGTNWSGTIANPGLEDLSPGAKIDIWDLLFELTIKIKVSFDFDITTTGASKGREKSKVASLSIPVKLFNIELIYNLVAEFDEHPIHVKGKAYAEMEYGIGTHGAQIENYSTPITIDSLEIKNSEDYNKDINFYIGTEFVIEGNFLKVSIDLGFVSVKIGPVLKLDQDFNGGCYFTARHDKNQSQAPDGSRNEIHSCAAEGKDGCLALTVNEINRVSITFTIDLYFDDWTLGIKDTGEQPVTSDELYKSYTYGTGWQHGTCPHIFYKVPVRVWLDTKMTKPASGMEVGITDKPDLLDNEKSFTSAETNDNGYVYLYLPYKERYHYNFVAGGYKDGKHLAGETEQPVYMQKGANSTVDIIVKSDEKVTIKANLVWDVDLEKKEVPQNVEYIWVELQSRNPDSDEGWTEEWRKYASKSSGWTVEDFTDYPKFGFENEKAYELEYRLRIYDERSTFEGVIITPENGEYYIRHYVAGYTDAAGNTQQAHETRYYVSYKDASYKDERNNVVFTTTITATAVMDVKLNKMWKVSKPDSIPSSVYLALLQRPYKGWETIAAQNEVPADWTIIQEPIAGDAKTLKDMKKAPVLYDSAVLSEFEQKPIAVGEANSANDWSVSFTVPKFVKGVRMDFMASELDNNILKDLVENVFGTTGTVTVEPSDKYDSLPGIAYRVDDKTMQANVINTDPLNNNTLAGFVWWDTFMGWSKIPESVELAIYKNGEETPVKTITLNRSDYSDENTWFWRTEVDNYDPNAVYTVTETVPVGPDGKDWAVEVDGLDVYNYCIIYETVQCEAQATFDGASQIAPPIDYMYVQIKRIDNEVGDNEVHDIYLSRNNEWYGRDGLAKRKDVKDITDYELVAPDIEGYKKVYVTPREYAQSQGGPLMYNFTVKYMRVSENLKLNISTEFLKTDDNTEYPEEVNLEVYRDDDKIADVTLKQNNGVWSTATVDKDLDGKPLSRLDENDRKYVYTIRVTPIDGFTSKVNLAEDRIDEVDYVIENTWIGSECVNVKGTVSWEGDEGKEYLRPDTVMISVVNSDEETVKVLHVPVKEDGSFIAKYLPAEDVTYYVTESHVFGYTSMYENVTYDEATRTYTCNVTNKLTGLFPFTITKAVEGESFEEDEEYKFVIMPRQVDEDTRAIPMPIKADEIITDGEGNKAIYKITGQGSKTAEFFFDEQGLYIYSITEEKGNNKDCTYDSTEWALVVSVTVDSDGNRKIKSWVMDSSEEPGGELTASELFAENQQSNKVEFINKYPINFKNISGRKTWDDDYDREGSRPDSITIRLFADGTEVDSVKVTEADGWEWVFKDVPIRKSKTEYIEYTITEDPVEDYKSEVNEFDVTNTYIPPKTSVSVTKVWDDANNQDGFRPNSVTVMLLADGEDTGKRLTLSEANDWKGEFSDLLVKKDRKEIKYTVAETEESLLSGIHGPDTYTSEITGDAKNGYVITNTHIPETVNVLGKKTWAGSSDDRPATIRVMLKADGKIVDRQSVSKFTNWAWRFENLPRYKNGKEIEYTVAEYALADFTAEVRGYSIINTHAPGKTNVDVTVVWDDQDDQDGIRPESVTVKLLANGNDIQQTLELTGDDNWKGTFSDIPAYENGRRITYTAEEVKTDTLSGQDTAETYAITASGDASEGFTFTNKHTPVTTSVSVDKVWDDEDDQDGIRPESVTVKLLANGADTGKTVTLSNENSWSGVFSKLDILKNGEYTVEEVKTDVITGEDGPGTYSVSISSQTEREFTITNTHTPETLTIKGKKVWSDSWNVSSSDSNDLECVRPKIITIRLYANNEEIRTASVGEADGWKWEFTDLPKYADGEEIEYTINEDALEDYVTEIEGDAENGFTVTNTYSRGKTQVRVAVVWHDAYDNDGFRPYSVKVRLLANGEDTGKTLTLTYLNLWSGVFSRLDVAKDGKKIAYTVEEVRTDVLTGTDGPGTYAIDMSGSTSRGFVITNTHTPEKLDVNITKEWDDLDNHDGRRPNSVVIRLWSDGLIYREIRLNQESGWKWSFSNLPKYLNGRRIRYTVTEDLIPNYTAEITGDAESGFVVTNKHTPKGYGRITFDANGGKFENGKGKIDELYPLGTVITIPEAPTREGYVLQYWKGSSYQPGDKYTVKADHTFTAQWRRATAAELAGDTPAPAVPTSTGTDPNVVMTDDSNKLGLWFALMTFSLWGIAVISIRRKEY